MPNAIQYAQQSITPSKIICIGRNFVDHIEELGNEVPDDMVVFCKPNSAIGQTLKSFDQEPLHYEGELCFLYQQGQFVAVAFGLDLTKRDLQGKLKQKGLPWERAKAFDGAALFSTFVPFDNIDELALTLTIDDRISQQAAVPLMIYKPAQILANLQQFISLSDGDIVMTGTPKGVGAVQSGSRYQGSVSDGKSVLVSATWQAL
ncbi:fumarylacetoacetate hydrolase family protein [Thalassotalea ponticola]|uniref:fumarylacetoacetate hydrolase family protein n=1 Tax=Thalassotalea ponticola TaxID=1523392 RepID=UPI0025B49F03|nr:fumarylacetoacetate hydrolase family protein [Thalassotalea ponticola]MDN3653947.1 fumarylacetoacetate hydrolase family protein [Thalassotalea ponticola]